MGTKVKKRNEWIEWGKAIFFAIILVFLLRTFIFSASIVDGKSMAPTLGDGDRIIFNKFVYLIGEPKREDIIIIQRPLENYVKRVIALPGEVIEMKDHVLYINGEAYEQPFISNEAILHTGNFDPIEVPNDSYFVMGDNRANSRDSRNELGLIEADQIIGKSELIIFPFSEWSVTR